MGRFLSDLTHHVLTANGVTPRVDVTVETLAEDPLYINAREINPTVPPNVETRFLRDGVLADEAFENRLTFIKTIDGRHYTQQVTFDRFGFIRTIGEWFG